MERSGIGPMILVGFGMFMLGAMAFGGAASAGAASAGAVALWPVFALFKLVFFLLLFGFVARMFWGRGFDRRARQHGWRGPGPWGPPRGEREWRENRNDDEESENDPRAWFEQRVEDWHLKAHARMDIDRLVPDPTREDPTDEHDVV